MIPVIPVIPDPMKYELLGLGAVTQGKPCRWELARREDPGVGVELGAFQKARAAGDHAPQHNPKDAFNCVSLIHPSPTLPGSLERTIIEWDTYQEKPDQRPGLSSGKATGRASSIWGLLGSQYWEARSHDCVVCVGGGALLCLPEKGGVPRGANCPAARTLAEVRAESTLEMLQGTRQYVCTHTTTRQAFSTPPPPALS